MLITTIFFLLFTNAFLTRKDLASSYTRSAQLALLSAGFICYNNLFVINLEKGIGLYGGTFNITSLTQTITIFILLLSCLILVYNSFYHRTLMSNSVSSIESIVARKYSYTLVGLGDTKIEQYRIIEYPLVILFIICGGVFFMCSADLISLFITIELQSYGLYILSSLHRDSEKATWGGLTYFLLGGLSSCFILFGSGLLYVNSGTTSLEGLYIITTVSDIVSDTSTSTEVLTVTAGENAFSLSPGTTSDTASGSAAGSGQEKVVDTYYLHLSLLLMTVGFLFKVSAAPFHFWSPDVYDAIPTTVTTFVAIVAKLSIFIVVLDLVYFVGGTLSSAMAGYSWKNGLLISSLLSLLVGSILGLTQFRIKRVFAYSTISHVGFILLALSVDSAESIQGYLFYILSYTITNLNAFIILVTIGYTMYMLAYDQDKNNVLGSVNEKATTPPLPPLASTPTDRQSMVQGNDNGASLQVDYSSVKDLTNSPIELVNQVKGYFYINPYLSLSLAITLFSFIGIPPLLGFFAKQMVLSAALDNGYLFMTVVGILTSVIGAPYYLTIIKKMFFFKNDMVGHGDSALVFDPKVTTGTLFGWVKPTYTSSKATVLFKGNDIKISSALSIVISNLTLVIVVFIFTPTESFNLAKILTQLLLYN